MRWTVLAIAIFVVLYTLVSFFFRKENAAHLPYEEAQIRGGRALQEAGWEPFPNAYGIAGDSPQLSRLPSDPENTLPSGKVPFEVIDRRDERVAAWTEHLPPLEQGEQVRRVEAPPRIQQGQPYLARIFWEAPHDFRSPQLVVFRRDNRILVVPRAPERFAGGSPESTVLIIPPEAIEPGQYEVFLSTKGRVNRWTFRAE